MPKKIASLRDSSCHGRVVITEIYLKNILELIVSVVPRAFGSRLCSLMLLNNDDELVVRAAQSASKAYMRRPPVKLGEGVSGRVALRNQPMCIFDVYKDEHYQHKEFAKQEGIASLLCMPLSVKNKAIGVINLFTSKPYAFTEGETRALGEVSAQAAFVIHKAEQMVKTGIIHEEMESRKLIETAESLLMEENHIDEEAACELLYKISLDHCQTLHWAARSVILSRKIRESSAL